MATASATNPALRDKDEMVVAGIETAVTLVSRMLDMLIEQIEEQGRKMALRPVPEFGAPMGETLGLVTKLAIQKDTLVKLRKGIPEAILEGHAFTLATIVPIIE